MWYKAWREILQGVRLVMSLGKHRGLVDDLVVGISSRSSSGSTMEIEYVYDASNDLSGWLAEELSHLGNPTKCAELLSLLK